MAGRIAPVTVAFWYMNTAHGRDRPPTGRAVAPRHHDVAVRAVPGPAGGHRAGGAVARSRSSGPRSKPTRQDPPPDVGGRSGRRRAHQRSWWTTCSSGLRVRGPNGRAGQPTGMVTEMCRSAGTSSSSRNGVSTKRWNMVNTAPSPTPSGDDQVLGGGVHGRVHIGDVRACRRVDVGSTDEDDGRHLTKVGHQVHGALAGTTLRRINVERLRRR